MKIIAFGASSSRHSINKQFAEHALTHFEGAETTVLDLNDYEMPLFSVDREKEGYPPQARKFLDALAPADLLIISMAEHNGSYTAAFKNLFDWCSRIEKNTLLHKPIFLLSTSTGSFGGAHSLEAAVVRFPKHSAEILDTFSLPLFDEQFEREKGITNEELKKLFTAKVANVKARMEVAG